MRAEKVRARLAEGPCTWSELAAASGLDEQRCMVEVARLQTDAGCTIEIRQLAQVHLIYDPEHPVARTCAWPGCTERLRLHNGTGYCAIHTQAEARRRWMALTVEERRQLAEEVCEDEDGDAILALFDEQLHLEVT